ncbi:hypothetical protein BYT27DRAFT_7191502 [Phlegmacium glaucopus]|nr:hypothetical protein BYT27DRAFT_7191502 [Phlegmacium glaucopus]
MPEYVYALHDFLPENEDEVTFHAGERIEVIEKDDMYGDGWWQGRNLAGGVGLFPVSYTAPALSTTDTPDTTSELQPVSEPPGLLIDNNNNKSILLPLREESESESGGFDILSPVPKHPTTFFNDGYETDIPPEDASLNLDNEMMKATMTDVQKAIEQLGRGGVGEDSRSFSFASSRDGADTESDTDFNLSDLDGVDASGNDGEDWHKNARHKLAAKAKRAVEEAQKLEAIMADDGNARRAVAPPIEVELSDESDAEDDADFTKSSKLQRDHPYIPEEDEEIGTDGEATAATNDTRHSTIETSSTVEANVVVPPKDESDVPTATATKLSFSTLQSPVLTESPPEMSEERSPTPEKSVYPSPISPPTTTVLPAISTIQQTQKRSSTPVREIPNGLPSPASVGHNNVNSKHSSIVSSSSAPGMLNAATTQVQQQQHPVATNGISALATPASPQGRNKTHPTEWSVEEVVDWLGGKGFDQDVCDKFVEQEITGDVLLELDVNLLKSEIGVLAFGKRMRIANAISELRRPPSIEYSDHQLSPMQLHHSNSLTHSQFQPQSHSHSRTQSQSHSHHSFNGTIPAATVGHAHSLSMQSSSGGPVFGSPQQSVQVQDSLFNKNDGVAPAAVPVGTGNGITAGMSAAVGVGLGIALPPTDIPPIQKGRPTQLMLSPSDGALKDTAAKTVAAIALNGDDEDRGHMSDGELALNPTSMRRRLFGRSHESAISILNSSSRSKESPFSSPALRDSPDKEIKDKHSNKNLKEKDKETSSTKDTAGRHARSKKSMDSKHSDRLSIFGTTFVGTLGKHRKPPPSSDEVMSEKPSLFSLPRLHSTSVRKSSSSASRRPSTSSNGSITLKDVAVIYDEKHSATLRKRTNSNPIPVVAAVVPKSNDETVNGVSGPIKQGVNIMDQIGEPDHTGWMRKKGDRYNTWKVRYFILKGPHLYFMRNNNRSETRIKGYIHIVGYKVTVDENVDPGRYGFRIDHDHDKTHYFSSEEKSVIRDWMKAIMKATILRDYAKPVVSSCNIPTIPLVVAQAMNPAPRPPSPSAREATQRALRRENTEQLSTRDTRILMGLNVVDLKDERTRLDSFFSNEAIAKKEGMANNLSSPMQASAPPRPSRQPGRMNSGRAATKSSDDYSLIQWANTHLPQSLQITDLTGPLCSGLGLLRLAESIRGRPSSPPVPDSAFPADINDDKLDGLFRLFDFLLDHDVKMGSVSINDVRLGKRDKIIQLLKALKAWEDKRNALAISITKATGPAAFMTSIVV